jgi:tetratricopeptide (TPR) repeat protein
VLYEHDTQLYKAPLSRTLHRLGAHFCSAGYWKRAEESLREATNLRRQLYSADSASERTGARLALMLHEYAKSLEKLERKDEAQQAISEALVLRRKFFGSRCGPTSEIPAYVRSYGDYLFLDKSLLSDSE